MEPVTYTDPAFITAIHVDPDAPRNPYPGGYGRKIPTRYRLTCSDGRVRRVYAMQWGNAGSVYIRVGGAELFLDIDTEHAIQDARGPGA